jgi:integrase
VIGLPDALVDLLSSHLEVQRAKQAAARQLWLDEDWVFATSTGGAASPNSGFHEWKALLGVAEYEMRERTVVGVMGWSSTSMAARYQRVTDPIRRDVAARMGDLLWSPDAELGLHHGRAEDRN